MSATACHHPVAAVADQIAAARTFADLAEARRNLKAVTAILPEELDALTTAALQREQAIIRYYLPNHR